MAKKQLTLVDKLSNDYTNNNFQPQILLPENPAVTAYRLGIKKVRDRGHTQTAQYMEHALVPASATSSWEPETYVHNNDAWARGAVENRMDLNGKIYNAFYTEIINKGRTYGTVTLSHTYTDGQYHTSLNNVTINVIFSQLQDRSGYKAVYKITDRFDFKWESNGYEQFDVGFGNNYCYLVQELGLIRNYNNVINYAP